MSRQFEWVKYPCVKQAVDFRPTKMHELLNVDMFQPFEFKGDIYHLNEDGCIRQSKMGWSNCDGDFITPPKVPDILTDIINNLDSILRFRLVDRVGIVKAIRALGPKYLLRVSPDDSLYLFSDLGEGVTFEDLFNWPADILKRTCTLYVPNGSPLKKDLLAITDDVLIKDVVWKGAVCSMFATAIDIDAYLKWCGNRGPIYERAMG